MMYRTKFAVVILALVLISSQAWAADKSIDAQMFRPSIFNGNFLAIEDARTLNALCYGFGLYVNYANSLAEMTDQEKDEYKTGVLDAVTTGNLTLAFAPFHWLSLGADVPYHFQGRAKSLKDIEDEGLEEAERQDVNTLGDIKAEIKLGLLKEKNVGLGLALGAFATFPTGEPDLLLGEGTTNFGGKLMIEKDLKIFNVAANGGYLVRPERDVLDFTLGNGYLFGAGISRTIVGGLSFSVEYWGQQFKSSSNEKFQANPMEVTGTLRYKFGAGPRIIGGGSAGGGGGVGSPTYRMIAGFDYYPACEAPKDGKLVVIVKDEAGVPLPASLKVSGAKKFDVDTEKNGQYAATVEPGEYDAVASAPGYKEGSGSTKLAAGKTATIVIALKAIPKPTSLTVSVVKVPGGDPLDDVAVTMENTTTKTKYPPKTIDKKWTGDVDAGFYKFQGTKAGFADAEAAAQIHAEKANEVTLKLSKKIVPIGKILFFYDSDKMRPETTPVLNDLLDKIHEEQKAGTYKKLIIEGHCSFEGTEEYNNNLSARRAKAVKAWLVEKGIPEATLETIGYGESKPIADNSTEAGKEQNRRVEFILGE